jgi:hypothetical protein
MGTISQNHKGLQQGARGKFGDWLS